VTKAFWFPPMDAALEVAWKAGLSASQIAVLLGGGATATSVRRRRTHLGLRPRGVIETSFGGKRKAASSTLKPSAPMPTLARLGPDSDPKPMDARAWSECAFPVGDDDQGLIACGGHVAAGSRRRYCAFHLTLTVREACHDERAA
jgi:hypothetical protein